MEQSSQTQQDTTVKSVSEELKDMADDAKSVGESGGFMKPGTTRKRGRPRKEDQKIHSGSGGNTAGTRSSADSPAVDPIAELMPLTQGLASFYSNMLVQLAEDQRAALTKEKHEIIAHTSAVCLNQYLPGVLGAHASAIVLGVTVLETSLTAMRLRRENLQKLQEEAKKQNQAFNGAGQKVSPFGAEQVPAI